MLKLRYYQEDALTALYDFWREGGQDGLIVLPTGSGKSLVIAELMRRLLAEFPQLRVICVTHTRELIVQNYQELVRIWPGAPAGIYSAGVGRRDHGAKILFCGVQSVYKKTRLIGAADLIIIDEAHLIPRNTATMYGRFLEGMRGLNRYMRLAGLTATDYRLDSGRLSEGEDALFEEVVYEAGVLDLIEKGFLSKLISKASVASMDVKGIGTRAGEFIAAEAEARAMEGDLVQRAVAEMVALGEGRKSWLAFCITVAHAEAVAEALRARGIRAAHVEGTMDKGTRASIIRQFREGQLQALTSVNVLSIGFNVPQVDLIALMRPTKSPGLYIQQVGRGFRLAPRKENCLVLDFAKVVQMHGPVDAVIPPTVKAKGATPGDAPVKVCPNCASYVPISVRVCEDCGHEFPPAAEEPKHEDKADDTAGILSTEPVKPTYLPVVSWRFSRHEKFGMPDSACVNYQAGLNTYREWVCFEHSGFPQQKAVQWWALHGGKFPAPLTVSEAFERQHELRMPAGISVRPDGKFFQITGRVFEQKEKAA
jgi:DNA repair protein RadD